jgi:transcriptional regulator with XRE-family HTH domain
MAECVRSSGIESRMLTSTWRGKNRAVVTIIQASRREADLTQRDLADRLPKWLGWDQTTLAKVETSRRRLDLVEFLEIAKALKLDPAVLFARVVNWK